MSISQTSGAMNSAYAPLGPPPRAADGAARSETGAADAADSTASARRIAASARPAALDKPASEPIDPATGEPKPPNFPWLSRLTAELQAASSTRPAYQPSTEMGTNVDRKA